MFINFYFYYKFQHNWYLHYTYVVVVLTSKNYLNELTNISSKYILKLVILILLTYIYLDLILGVRFLSKYFGKPVSSFNILFKRVNGK